MITITPFGAAGEVTGSAYLLQTPQSRVLIDFGMFQGDREDEARNLVPGELHRIKPDCIVLTHGHLDHCGRLPMLVRDGFLGKIFATTATKELTTIILSDAAHIQQSDYEHRLRRAQRKGWRITRADEPAFDDRDVADTIKQFVDVEYNVSVRIQPDIEVVFYEAGHMLGSASVEFKITHNNKQHTIVFSGDLGPLNYPILNDYQPPISADVVVMEATYGNRDHRNIDETLLEFEQIVQEVIATKGKLFIPTFAIGRAQQLLFHFAELFAKKQVPSIPVYLDSPMAIKTLNVYENHPTLFDAEATALKDQPDFIKQLQRTIACETSAESRAINDAIAPFVVLAGAGMCNAGRIVHHLRNNLHDPSTHILIAGYQARGSLGRTLVDGAKHVRIMGQEIPVNAKIHTLGGLSAHAGQKDLLHWISSIKNVRQLVLTHSEDSARSTFATLVQSKLNIPVQLPTYKQEIVLQ